MEGLWFRGAVEGEFVLPPCVTFQRLDRPAWASRGLPSFADRDREEIEHDFSTDHAFPVTRGKTSFNCVLLVFLGQPGAGRVLPEPLPLSVHTGCSWQPGALWKLLQHIRGGICSFL